MTRTRILLATLVWLSARTAIAEPRQWAGVDETVVEQVATAAGQHPWRTLLDDSGDLPLFLFLCAGIAGGFVLGYGYRALFARRQPNGAASQGEP